MKSCLISVGGVGPRLPETCQNLTVGYITYFNIYIVTYVQCTSSCYFKLSEITNPKCSVKYYAK